MLRLILCAVALMLCFSGTAVNAGERILLTYDVVWNGLKVFSIDISVLTGNRRYIIDMKGETKGLASLFAGGNIDISSEGRLTRTGPMPQLYNNMGRWGGDDFRTTLFYTSRGKFLGQTQVRPEEWQEKYKLEPVPEDMQQGADPASLAAYFAQGIIDYAAHGSDNPLVLRTFDGRRVVDYKLECGAEPEKLKKTSRSMFAGEARVCRADFEVVAGKIIPTPELEAEWEEQRRKAAKRRQKDEDSADGEPYEEALKVWIADADNSGLELPVRAAVKAGWGTARMYLKSYRRVNFPARVAARVIDPSYCAQEIKGQTRYC